MALSPSKLDEAADCIRRPAWQALDPLPYVQGREAEFGSLVHQVAEDYHTHGKAPDRNTREGQVFLPGLKYVPKPLCGRAEGKFRFRVAGVEFSGLIDLACSVGDLPAEHRPDLPAETPVVVDYKSVKALSARYMLDGEQAFLCNRQALTYAAKRLVETRQQVCVLWWIYLRRGAWDEQRECWVGRPAAELRWSAVSLAQVTEAFGRLIHPLAVKLTQIKLTKPNPLDLPPNPDSCLRYGPKYACPRIKQCQLTLADQLKEMDVRDLLDELNAEEGPVEPAPAKAAKKAKGINPEPIKVEQEAKVPMNEGARNTDADLGKAVRLLFAAWKNA